ncbi:MAG: hypothetical protein DSZ03_03650 [Sulfurimonas sp.]|nr:MAG: hypothetical protein DSZ03_03650 [Sulfurimonas sp.]
MTIESFALEMHSEHTKTTSVATGFLSELEAENAKRTQELEAANAQMSLDKVLEYELIRQLLASLQSGSYACETYDAGQFAQKNGTYNKERREYESLEVSMKGIVRTPTQEITLSLDVAFSSSFVARYEVERSQFYDPLVINFDGTLPQLQNETFTFDLDCDGVGEAVAPLQEGSGFLALDKNRNGTIDDGSELFGATNGNGFVDLSRYDSDNNRWIDANDAIFNELRIWSSSSGERRLIPLAELGIGALYLGYTKNDFDLKNDHNEVLGRIRSNGLYLNEDGTSGLMTQIDLANRHKHAGRKMQASDLQHLLKAVS